MSQLSVQMMAINDIEPNPCNRKEQAAAEGVAKVAKAKGPTDDEALRAGLEAAFPGTVITNEMLDHSKRNYLKP